VETKKRYLSAVAIIFVVLTLMTVTDCHLLEQWMDTALSNCPAFRVPGQILDVRAVNNRNGIDVRLINITSANLKNIKLMIYLPKVNNVSYKDDEVYMLGSCLIKDYIHDFKPDQVKTYHIDLSKFQGGADLGKIHYFAGGYYKYVLNVTHFGTDQPLFH
jgi:hypothetical protein